MSAGQTAMGEEFNPKRMALLHFYATTIEGLVHMIYRSDPDKYAKLVDRLHVTIVGLQNLAKQESMERAECDADEERCDDGLCHPKGDPTCSGVIILPLGPEGEGGHH